MNTIKCKTLTPLAFQELIELVVNLQCVVELQQKRIKDTEDYLDDLLLRVMETTPRILQNPYVKQKNFR